MRASTLCVLLAMACTSAAAQVRTGSTVEASTQTNASTKAVSELDATDRVVQEIWGLSSEEMRRSKVLAQGPRRNFSVPNLSPLEILGIHARTDAERRQYAERFAKIFRADVERSIAWDRAYTEAMAKLYPNDPMISFDGMPKVQSSVGAADMGNVPRTQIIEHPAPSSRVPARSSAKP
ncbi:integrating conjugative element protein [Comamonas sp.]|uniref:integrating conjugative element protein n=1 Tax=Comamonas sp. TaxID=34028 RepID=UPI002587C1F4|nr:integrating conjugative element protein [Comamonas sp.]